MKKSTTYTFLPVVSLASREMIRFYRQRGRIIGSLATPLLFWLFLGSGLGAAFPAPMMPGGKGYLEYFFPGIVVMTILFTSIFSTISLIEDRNEGFLQSVLVAPVSPIAMVGGKVAGGTMLSLFQGVLFLLLAPLAGFQVSVIGFAQALLAMAVISFGLTALGFYFAWKLDSVQGFHSIMNVLLFPMWLLSGAFFSVKQAPAMLKPIMYLNPLTYGLSALQDALYQTTAVSSLMPYGQAVGVCFAFGVVFYAACALLVVRRSPTSTHA